MGDIFVKQLLYDISIHFSNMDLDFKSAALKLATYAGDMQSQVWSNDYSLSIARNFADLARGLSAIS